MEKLVKVTVNKQVREVAAGTLLSTLCGGALPCGGHGKCGKCKVKASGALSPLTETEKARLTEAEIAAGIRLSCQTAVCGECVLETVTESGIEVLTEGKTRTVPTDPVFRALGVAIDVGTTTLAAKLLDRDGNTLAVCGKKNPQAAFGADVISRIEAALAGKGEDLARTLTAALDEMILTLARDAGRDPDEIDALTVTGNTAMLYLFTKTSPEPLSHAPFTLTRPFGETISAATAGLSAVRAETPLYLPPVISAFVGADTVCALLAAGLREGENAMLADIGTNGEMALWKDGALWVCSTAAGPAFEGVGISCGMCGAAGAIDRVSIVNGAVFAHVLGDTTPIGICGSGLIDTVAALLDLGILDETGLLEDGDVTVLAPVVLTQRDVRACQLAKSAIAAGLGTLLHEADADPDEISRLCLAGGFGNVLDKRSAARIGLLPVTLAGKAEGIGNAALDGAVRLILDRGARAEAERLARKSVTLNLAESTFFSDAFVEEMSFPE